MTTATGQRVLIAPPMHGYLRVGKMLHVVSLFKHTGMKGMGLLCLRTHMFPWGPTLDHGEYGQNRGSREKMCRLCVYRMRAFTPGEVYAECQGHCQYKDAHFNIVRFVLPGSVRDTQELALCLECEKEHDEDWHERWNEYHAGLY